MPQRFVQLSRSSQSRILRRIPRNGDGNERALRLNEEVNNPGDNRIINNAMEEEEQRDPHLLQQPAPEELLDSDEESTGSDDLSEDTEPERDDSSDETADIANDSLEEEEEPEEETPPPVEMDSSSDEDEHVPYNFNQFNGSCKMPLYAGAPVTVLESMCLILSLVLKHNLTSACISDMLQLINTLCIQEQLQKLSLNRYQKFFSLTQEEAKKFYYCSRCIKPLESVDAQCYTCRKDVSYFLQIPLIPQLSQLFQRRGFLDSLQHRFRRQKINENNIEDIYDASLYKSQCVNNGLLASPHNISFLWNSDGVPVFKSRNYSIWPFYLAINELPYKQRLERKNVLLAGLWFGPKKPFANLFVKAFREDLAKLYRGISFQVEGSENLIKVRAILLAGTCDLPAKSTFLNFKQFNAHTACPNCETHGVQVLLPSGKSIHVYNYVRDIVIRTSENVREQAHLALESGQSVMGVEGPTILDKLMPDVMAGMGIDTMHNVSGIVKKLLKLWFDAKFSRCAFSLWRVLQNVDAILLSLKPPKFIHGMPRSVEDLCHRKGSELIVWLYYYAPVILQDIMRPDYYQHFMMLVVGLSYLSCPSVSHEMIEVADRVLYRFVEDFQALYGIRYCSINIHLLLHLGHQVKTLGPLWTCSCFPFENLNALLLNSIHGITHVDSQVVRQHWQVLCSSKFLDRLPNGPVRDFCLWKKKTFKVLSQIGNSCYSVGYYCNVEPHLRPIREALYTSRIPYHNVQKYLRLFKSNMMYVSEGYTRDLQTKSSFCFFLRDNQKYVGNIICFVKVCRACAADMICLCNGEHYAVMKRVILGEKMILEYACNAVPAPLSYLHKCYLRPDYIAVPVQEISTVCFYMSVNNQSYVAEPAHLIEVQ